MADSGTNADRRSIRVKSILKELRLREAHSGPVDLEALLVELCPGDDEVQAEVRRLWKPSATHPASLRSQATAPAQRDLIDHACRQVVDQANNWGPGSIPGYTVKRFIASGGVSSLEDVRALNELGLYAAIIGKAYYTGAIKLSDAITEANA